MESPQINDYGGDIFWDDNPAWGEYPSEMYRTPELPPAHMPELFETPDSGLDTRHSQDETESVQLGSHGLQLETAVILEQPVLTSGIDDFEDIDLDSVFDIDPAAGFLEALATVAAISPTNSVSGSDHSTLFSTVNSTRFNSSPATDHSGEVLCVSPSSLQAIPHFLPPSAPQIGFLQHVQMANQPALQPLPRLAPAGSVRNGGGSFEEDPFSSQQAAPPMMMESPSIVFPPPMSPVTATATSPNQKKKPRRKKTVAGSSCVSARERRKIEKPEKCPLCGAGFAYKADRDKHLVTGQHRAQAHNFGLSTEKFSCLVGRCRALQKTFARKDGLKRHRKNKHGLS
ncbi:hypothetical protein QBC46DRAFT_341712 [Diplogelasinospora grovesii]|uniref:C2H2-type domain-containing protein n=1 Tax=Diplogelasinospora grovesii TaxID=303347 RepID=A0AAN6N6X8_9PEZI|nr:hypothetical protein QBC46DRAFT_341712 [Diplogelasinospora grovesii]